MSTDPFQIKKFTNSDSFENDFSPTINSNDKNELQKSANFTINESVTNDTAYFSVTSERTTNTFDDLDNFEILNSISTSTNLNETTIDNKSKINLETTIRDNFNSKNSIDNDDENKLKTESSTESSKLEKQFGQLSIESNSEEDTTNKTEQLKDPFNTNLEIDEISAFSNNDPFNSKIIDDNNQNDLNNDDNQNDKELNDDKNETSFEIEFETLPSNITYLEPRFVDKNDDQYIDDLDNLVQIKENYLELNQQFNNELSFGKSNRRLTLEKIDEVDQETSNESIKQFDQLEKQLINENDNYTDDKIIKEDDNEIIKEDDNKIIKEDDNELIKEDDNEIIKEDDDKIEKWRLLNDEKIRIKDENELKLTNQLVENAKKELDDWYFNYKNDLNSKKTCNRSFEEEIIKKTEEINNAKDWKTIVGLCDFGYKNGQKDTSRFRNILFQLKNSMQN